MLFIIQQGVKTRGRVMTNVLRLSSESVGEGRQTGPESRRAMRVGSVEN